jgi:transcription termination/antitermination protein NusA
MNELRGEKIDIIEWREDPAEFVAKALSPAKVKEVQLLDDGQTALVIVPDYQLSLAIGKEGQNARLAARLTGLRVDIKSESQVRKEEEEAAGGGEDAEASAEEPAQVAAEGSSGETGGTE